MEAMGAVESLSFDYFKSPGLPGPAKTFDDVFSPDVINLS